MSLLKTIQLWMHVYKQFLQILLICVSYMNPIEAALELIFKKKM